ncbi:MAG TPA: hypothetical protein VFM18_21755 [Methanosarcina sp.]|nr:hypothetical protein [Methanosarcina sp.]
MSTQIQWRKGTTTQHSSFTGANAEITVDTDKKAVVVHDGVTVGGTTSLTEKSVHNATAKTSVVDADELALQDSASSFSLKKFTLSNLWTYLSGKLANTGIGNLLFTGTSNRITGDFSNATIASRVMFQSSTLNGNTSVSAIPNGGGNNANFSVYSNSGATDAYRGQFAITESQVSLQSNFVGTAGYIPMTFWTGGEERLRIDTSGNVGIGVVPHASWTATLKVIELGKSGTSIAGSTSNGNVNIRVNSYNDGANKYAEAGYDAQVNVSRVLGSVTLSTYASGTANEVISSPSTSLTVGQTDVLMTTANGGIGYGVGSGGTVTQATNRTTAVTLNKPSGEITLVSAAGSTTWQSFTVNNSLVAATDHPTVIQKSGTDLYEIHVTAVSSGSFRVSFKTTGGTTTEQPVFRFNISKGSST